MKVAIVGSGAAATGVLAGLERFAPAGTEVTVFDIGTPVAEPPPGLEDGCVPDAVVADVYRRLREESGGGFPPPKSHFGQSLSRHRVEDRPLLWKSEHRGGLTNFWGGGMFPFTDREFQGWPVTAAEMDPYYRILADRVGVCGEPDRLNEYFPSDYVNRPPLRTSPVIEKLRDTINAHGDDGRRAGYRMVAGASRLALETRPQNEHACVYCGECMVGCGREAIWSARRELAGFQQRGTVTAYVEGRVQSIRERQVHYLRGDGGAPEVAGPFDRIFLAAGVIGSTEIVMRSFGLARGPEMIDTAILSFPLMYAGAAGGFSGGGPDYFSLCNLTVMGIPDDPSLGAAQVSVYPSFDHLWRFYTPQALWGGMRPLWRFGRWRLMLGRVYLDGAADRRLALEMQDGRLVIHRGAQPDVASVSKPFMESLRQVANHAGFYVPPVPPIGHGTSSHYGCTLPYGGGLVDVARSGRIAPGVYLADASAFPTLPALSPTFTIMANACRSAHEALQE